MHAQTDWRQTENSRRARIRGVSQRGAWAVVLLGLVLSTAAGLLVHRAERTQRDRVFREQFDNLSRQMVGQVREHALVARSVDSFYRSSDVVEADEFETFVALPLSQLPGLTAVAYAEVKPDGTPVVIFVQPAEMAPELLGVQLPDIMPGDLLPSVVADGMPRLVALPAGRFAADVAVIHPIFARRGPDASAAQRGPLQGYVLVLLELSQVVEPVSIEASGLGLSIAIKDGRTGQVMYQTAAAGGALATELDYEVLAAKWRFCGSAGPRYVQAHALRAGLLMFLLGIAFSVLVASILLVVASEHASTARWAARLEGLNDELSRGADRREKLLAALTISEQRFAAFMDNLPALGWVKDSRQRYLYANRFLLDHLGLERNDVEGRLDADLYHPETAQESARNDLRALAGERLTEGVESLRTPAGEGGRWLVTRFAFPGPDGTTLLGGMAIDVADTKQVSALARQAEELVRSNAELEQFAYVASHDLQAPLRHVLSYLQMLVEDHAPSLDGEARYAIERAVAGAERMRALITDLLAYSRVGRMDRPAEPVDLDALLESVVVELAEVIQAQSAEVTWADMPVVTMNANRARQLFTNLIGNAVKFRSAAPPRVRITAERQAAEWLIRVEDNGIGIPEQHRQRVFSVFQRLHADGTYEGTGIGLAVCRKIVEQAGGRIWIQDAPEQGTVIGFTWPIRESDQGVQDA